MPLLIYIKYSKYFRLIISPKLSVVNFDKNGKISSPLVDIIQSIGASGGGGYTPSAQYTKFADIIKNNRFNLDDKSGKTWVQYAKQIGYTDKQLLTFLGNVDSGKQKIGDIGKELGAAGTASQEFGEAVKSAVINMGAMLLVMVAIKGAMWIFDELNVTTEEQQGIVDDLTEKVKGLKDEYNELYGRNDLTEAEKQKLDYLQRQLTVNEQILKQEQKKLGTVIFLIGQFVPFEFSKLA